MTATNEIDEIRKSMARIRRELHEDVRGVVESAEAVTDWKHWIRDYPWASAAAALAIGYLVVPRRRKTVKPAEVAQAVAAQIQPVVQQAVAPAPEPKKKGRGLIGAGLGLLAPIALRAAQNYATHFVSNWIAGQQEQFAQAMASAGVGPQPGMGPGNGPGFGARPGRPAGPSQTQGGTR